MLLELTIRNFAIIDEVHLRFETGFNVLTGETGAGKSIIIDALSLLLGGRGVSDFIRAGTKSAYVEGMFRLSPDLKARLLPRLEAEGLDSEDDDLLLLSREIRAAGRNFCRVNGRSVSLNLLAELAAPLVDIHGQHHHLSLLQVKAHQAFLDRYGNLQTERRTLAEAFKSLQTVRRELQNLRQNAQQIARRIDQLQFQVEEIEAADLSPDEDEALTHERNRLGNAEKLSALVAEAGFLLTESSDDQPSVADLMGRVVKALNGLTQIDESTIEINQLAEAISYEVEDLSGQLQTYAETVEFNPARLDEVEERLSLIYNLKRKYGDSITEILAYGEKARRELESISNSEARIELLAEQETTLRHEVGQLAAALSARRREAGDRLAAGVEQELQALGMARTQFHVSLERTPHPQGVFVDENTFACDETGIDQVEFLIAPNPGEPLKPMVKIASGGETSRLMLALKTVLAAADETPTLIFDEIDQGIGGRIGGVVGEKLWGLTDGGRHQVLCITHLPQIAAFGDIHYHVAKQIDGERTLTAIAHLPQDPRIEELAQMLGTLSDATRTSARELLADAGKAKQAHGPSAKPVTQAALL